MSEMVRLKKLPANLLHRVTVQFCRFSTQCRVIIIIIIIIIIKISVVYCIVIIYDTQ
jgi:hypothetical protein